MTTDIRAKAAQYYDLSPHVPDDLPFYWERVPRPDARLLEIGCGTGRTLVPLVSSCGYIHGIDLSEGMLALCQQKLRAAAIPPEKAQVEWGDITHFALGRTFDLIIAPYRVFQNLETDRQVEGMFQCVRRHLSPDGTCILTAFRPYGSEEELRRTWCRQHECFVWETHAAGARITCHDRNPRMAADQLILYPEWIYRRYEGDVLTDETVLQIAWRCYYPAELLGRIRAHGFKIVACWGGYAGEPYGEGPELVVQFTQGN